MVFAERQPVGNLLVAFALASDSSFCDFTIGVLAKQRPGIMLYFSSLDDFRECLFRETV